MPDAAHRRTLLVICFGLTCSVAIYVFVAYTLAQQPGWANRKDPLTGLLEYLPHILPILLLALGWFLYNAIAFKDSGPGQASWSAVQTGFIAMLAHFDLNVIVGLVFFFLGAPFEKFLLFALGTLTLHALGLRRLLATWPRP